MALRFRKSIKLAPGVRMNLSGSGIGWTLGPRGASIGVSKRGTRLNGSFGGIPSSQAISRPKRTTRPTAPVQTQMKVSCSVDDDGVLVFRDADGELIPEHLAELAKKQHKDGLLGLVQAKCDEINSQIESVAQIHLETPDCRSAPRFIASAFNNPEPNGPKLERPGWLDKLFKNRHRRLEERNRLTSALFQQAMSRWRAEKEEFQREQRERRDFVERRIRSELPAMEAWLEEVFSEIEWPRETLVAFDIADDGRRVALDVDLPEISDMPNKLATVPLRGMKLAVKELSATKVQKLYMEHIHAVAFRLAGEAFAALPGAQEVVLSGYSQRHSAATGQLRDEYLLSVRVLRDQWQQIDFQHLDRIEVVEAFTRFELRRSMSKTGIFKPIEPLT